MSENSTNPKFVIKRNNDKAQFNSEKIESAIYKAYVNLYYMKEREENEENARAVARQVVEELKKVNKEELHVEEIQDIVEMVLMRNDPNVAKAYILYRNKHAELRNFRSSLGISTDELKVPINSLIVLAARYLLKDENGSGRNAQAAILESSKGHSQVREEIRKERRTDPENGAGFLRSDVWLQVHA